MSRREYEMTEEQLVRVLEASKPTPVLLGSGGLALGSSPQENANRAWRRLGEEMGFQFMTVAPVPGQGVRVFTAEPA